MDKKVEYPAIMAFVRGYLHEDAMVQYGSARAAAQQFFVDADQAQIQEWRREWEQFRRRYISLNEINHRLHQLGCAWLFQTIDEFEQMLDTSAGPKPIAGGEK